MGHWFHQELFGTDLQMGLEIRPPPPHAGSRPSTPPPVRVAGNLIVVGLILWAEALSRHQGQAPGPLPGRLRHVPSEWSCCAPTHHLPLPGLSRNAWVSLGVILVGIVVAARLQPIDRQPLRPGPRTVGSDRHVTIGGRPLRQAAPASIHLLGPVTDRL